MEKKTHIWSRKCPFNVCGPYVVILLNKAPLFDLYIARLMVKIGHQNNTCHNEVGLCAHDINTILNAIVNAIGRIYMIF